MTPPLASVEDVVFQVANVLRVPVLIVALAALALVVIELGALSVELVRRRRRDSDRLEQAAFAARTAQGDDREPALLALQGASSSEAMANAVARVAGLAGAPGAETRIAKSLADFDLRSLRRLERTRMLVRAGPALGLMGTLIPLSPALSGLASGDVTRLTDNLRVAFSITVLGLLIGALAFGVSLVRDRLYAQDLSDLEFVASVLEER
ncbi:MAG: MotA/TolQ/ExbB proton channel family protein [Solirubrobacteraceae bacterium]